MPKTQPDNIQAAPTEQPPGELPGAEQQQVSPEVQEQFDIFVVNGMEIIHDEKVADDFLARIMKSQDPVQSIAEATVDVVNRLYDSAAQNGTKLSPETLVHGSNILMGEIITVAESAGMQPLNDEQKTQSYQLAVSKYVDGAVKTGKMSKQELETLGQQASQTPQGQEITQQMQGQAQPQQPAPQPAQKEPGLLSPGGM